MRKNKKFAMGLMALLTTMAISVAPACGMQGDTGSTGSSAGAGVSTTWTVTIIGTKTTTQTISNGETVRKPADPIRSNFEFKGWYVNGVEYDWSTPVTSDITIEAKWEANTDFTVHNGAVYKNDDGDYYAGSTNSLISLKDVTFSEGALNAAVLPTEACDAGIIFGAREHTSSIWWEENAYYTVIVNFNGTILLARVDGGTWTEIANSPVLEATYDPTSEYAIKVQYKDGICVVTVNGTKVITAEIGTLYGNIVGYRTSKSGTVFSKDVTVDATDVPSVTAIDYTAYSGSYEMTDNNLAKSMSGNTLAIKKSDTYSNGSLTTTMKAATAADNAVVFGFSNPDNHTTVWEGQNNISYYVFMINQWGDVLFAKVAPTWSMIQNAGHIADYSVENAYEIKIQRKDARIVAFINGQKYIDYIDANPLTGTGYGFRTAVADVTFTEFAINETDLPAEQSAPVSLTVHKGSYSENSGVYTSDLGSSLAAVKNATFTGGTLSVDVKAGTAGCNGVVFGLTVPTDTSDGIWENADDSYYFAFIDEGGRIRLTRFVGSWNEPAGIVDTALIANYDVTATYTMTVEWNSTTGVIEISVGGTTLTYTDANPLTGTGYGFRAQTAGVTFENVTVTA